MSNHQLRAYVRALRPRQWVKNVLVAAAPVAASSLDETKVLLQTLGAIVVFTLAAGATYLANDAADISVDRQHPTKRRRPVAAGEISPQDARLVSAVLASVALVAATLIAWPFGVVIAAYLAINAWYTAGMKRVPVLEMAAIASGFILRAIGGGAATDTPLSVWFVVVVCAASLFVVAGKRSAELFRTGGWGGRAVLGRYSAHGLRLVRAASAALAVVAYGVWVFAQDDADPWWAGVSLLPFAASLGRYSAVIESGRGEDPEDVLANDHLFQVGAVLWTITYGVAVYG